MHINKLLVEASAYRQVVNYQFNFRLYPFHILTSNQDIGMHEHVISLLKFALKKLDQLDSSYEVKRMAAVQDDKRGKIFRCDVGRRDALDFTTKSLVIPLIIRLRGKPNFYLRFLKIRNEVF